MMEKKHTLPKMFTVIGLDNEGQKMKLVWALLESVGVVRCAADTLLDWTLCKVDVSIGNGYFASSGGLPTQLTLDQFVWDYGLAPADAECVAITSGGRVVWYKTVSKQLFYLVSWRDGWDSMGNNKPSHTILSTHTQVEPVNKTFANVYEHFCRKEVFEAYAKYAKSLEREKETVDKPWAPEIGVECEVLHEDEWVPVFIVGKDREGDLVFQLTNTEYKNLYSALFKQKFRPIKTEREKFEELFASTVGDGISCDSFYDALKSGKYGITLVEVE